MAVFWFGLGKKIKNIFTKKEADQLYLSKTDTGLQNVQGLVDFYGNIVAKRNGYVDYVDTNAPTSMINKSYLESNYVSQSQADYKEITYYNRIFNNLNTVTFRFPNGTNLHKPILIYFNVRNKTTREVVATVSQLIHTPTLTSRTNKWFVGSNMQYSTATTVFEVGQLCGFTIVKDKLDYRFTAQIFGGDLEINGLGIYGSRY